MPRILVADDNSNIQKMVALAFEEHGIDVVAVGNGEAAVRRLPDLNPDVVLADVFMPVRNGYEVCEFVKKDPRFAKIPVILLVGAFDPLDEQEARRVGADGVLKKPFVPPDPLIAMVTSALEKNAKPQVTASADTAVTAEIPKVAAPVAAPPAPIPSFPDPTPEEEAYMFGSGRRSLDEDEKTEAAAPVGMGSASAPAAVQTAVETDADSEDDAKFSGTRADWRRREEVDFAAVPSFSAELVDAPAEARTVESSAASQNVSPFAELRAESPVLESDPFAAAHETESKVESIVASGAVETVEESPVTESVFAGARTITEESNRPAEVSAFSHEPVLEATAPETPTAEAPAFEAAAPAATVLESPAAESQEVAAREVETRKTEPPVSEARLGEPVVAEAAGIAPQIEPAPVEPPAAASIEEPVAAAPSAKVEVSPPAAEPEPTLVAAVVDTVTSPRKWLDFLLPSRGARSSSEPTPADVVARLEAHSAHPPVENISASGSASASASGSASVDAPVAETVVAEPAAPESVSQAPTAIEPPPPAVYEPPPAEPVSAQVAPLESPAPATSILESGQHWSEIASQLAAEAPLVEAAQSAMNAEPAPVAQTQSPVIEPPAPDIPAAEVQASVAQHPGPAPVHTGIPAPQAVAPSLDSLGATISAGSVPQTPPPGTPNVDEVVARILEKLGPQIQEMLAKGVVRPLVEDMLQKPEDKKK